MKKITLAIIAGLLCFPLFGQNLAANQVQINKRTFTIGTSTYDADYNVIFNQWYKGHKNAGEAKQGEDLSWINDFTRTYTLGFQEGNLAVGGNDLGIVKIISFSRSGGTRNAFGEIGTLAMEQWLVYDAKTKKLIGAQFQINTYNAYIFVKPDFFDLPDFAFPLKVSKTNAPISTINANGLVSYKNVYEFDVTTGSRQSIYQVSGEIAKKLKEADDYAKALRRDIPSLLGELKKPPEPQPVPQPVPQPEPENAGFKNATHKLTADLNVFSRQDGGSEVVTSLKKGDPVQVLEYGDYASWNGITAKWAKVQTADSKTGWLFSGYIEAINTNNR
jgi:hypothetical protein